MGRKNQIDSDFWIDNYTSMLDPIEKLLFIYLITNPHTNIAGVYQIPLKTIATDTGIDRDMVVKILDRFSKEKKVFYYDGFVIVANRAKHNSPKLRDGVIAIIEKTPLKIKEFIKNMIQERYPIDTVSIGYPLPDIDSSSSKSLSESSVLSLKEPKQDVIINNIIDNFIKLWNARDYVIKVQKMNESRKQKFKARLKDSFFAENWEKALTLMDESPFLTGKTKKADTHANWKPDFDYFMRPETVIKIIEGKYGATAAPQSDAEKYAPPVRKWARGGGYIGD